MRDTRNHFPVKNSAAKRWAQSTPSFRMKGQAGRAASGRGGSDLKGKDQRLQLRARKRCTKRICSA